MKDQKRSLASGSFGTTHVHLESTSAIEEYRILAYEDKIHLYDEI
jgi:hypothetical protein